MKTALLGKNEKNSRIKDTLIGSGSEVLLIEDLTSVKHIRSRDGGFEIYTDGENYLNDFVIFTEKPNFNSEITTLPKTSKIWNVTESRIKFAENITLPTVFLLDWEGETDVKAVGEALRNAIAVKIRKKSVFFLSKTVRTGVEGYEALYEKARQVGVNFIKYNEAKVDFDSKENIFTIIASDIYGEVSIDAEVLAIGGSGKTKDDIVRAYNDMRSKTDANLHKYFSQNIKSTVNGLYVLDGMTFEDDRENLDAVINEMKSRLKNRDVFVSIDEGKCAFCNNCFRVCPHAALQQDYTLSAMKPVEGKCNECGACIAVCPANAITWIKEKKTAKKGKKVIVYTCENSGSVLLDQYSDFIKDTGIAVEEIVCGCSMKPEDILSAKKSYDKVIIASCIDGACRHIDGFAKAKKASERAKDKMAKLGLESDGIYHIGSSWAMPMFLKDSIERILKEGAK